MIYTQLSDVEGELNGLYTFDREVLKVDPDAISAITAQACECLAAACKTE